MSDILAASCTILSYYLCLQKTIRRNKKLRIKRRRAAITRILNDPESSVWRMLLSCNDDWTFLRITGLDYAAFHELVGLVKAFIKEPAAISKKRTLHVELTTEDRVGLYLLYIGSIMDFHMLGSVFGVPVLTAFTVVRDFIHLIPRVLRSHIHAKIKFPTKAELALYATQVTSRYPAVRDVAGFIDGVAYRVGHRGDTDQTLYNPHHKDNTCTNFYLFAPDGKVKFATINIPGSYKDVVAAQSLISNSLKRLGTFKFCVNRAFSKSVDASDKFVSDTLISLRQNGMRAFQATFCRVNTRLPADVTERRNIINGCILVHNFRISVVGAHRVAAAFDHESDFRYGSRQHDRIRIYFDGMLAQARRNCDNDDGEFDDEFDNESDGDSDDETDERSEEDDYSDESDNGSDQFDFLEEQDLENLDNFEEFSQNNDENCDGEDVEESCDDEL
jgi:hypothetical protein